MTSCMICKLYSVIIYNLMVSLYICIYINIYIYTDYTNKTGIIIVTRLSIKYICYKRLAIIDSLSCVLQMYALLMKRK